MAEPIQSVAASAIPKLTPALFLAACRTGDLLFCEGTAAISKGIEDFTDSCFSHVLMIEYSAQMQEWLTVEATIAHGVHVGRLEYYTDRYKGDLVLARRAVLSVEDIHAALHAGAECLDDPYNVGEEIQMVGHRLLPWIHPEDGTTRYFCSALMQHMSDATKVPLVHAGASDPTPQDNWIDPTVAPVCALVKR